MKAPTFQPSAESLRNRELDRNTVKKKWGRTIRYSGDKWLWNAGATQDHAKKDKTGAKMVGTLAQERTVGDKGGTKPMDNPK